MKKLLLKLVAAIFAVSCLSTQIANGDSRFFWNLAGQLTDIQDEHPYADGPQFTNRLIFPHTVVCAADGRVYFTDAGANCIRCIEPNKTVKTIVGRFKPDEQGIAMSGFAEGYGTNALLSNPSGLVLSKNETVLYFTDENMIIGKVELTNGYYMSVYAGQPQKFDGDEDGYRTDVKFSGVGALAVGSNDVIYMCNKSQNVIRKIDANGYVSHLAGVYNVHGGYVDGPNSVAQFNWITGMCVGPDGALYVADFGNSAIRRVDALNTTTILGNFNNFGHVDGPVGVAKIAFPSSVEFENNRYLVFVDRHTRQIRKFDGYEVSTVNILPGSYGLRPDGLFYDIQSVSVNRDGNYIVNAPNYSTILLGIKCELVVGEEEMP